MIQFTKMHGLGNDYIYINNLNASNIIERPQIPAFTRYICNRHFGVGADGIILIKPSKIADLKMEIYNSDGSQAQMCGNGIRCFGKYVYDTGILRKKEFTIETLAGIKKIAVKTKERDGKVEEVAVNMGRAMWNDNNLPIIIRKNRRMNPTGMNEERNKIQIQALDWRVEGTALSMGNPHFVILTKDIEKIDVEKYGSFIENYIIFPEKTNVEFVEVLGNTSIKMRVWERGAGETFACGTGACAAFAVCYQKKLVKSEVTVSLLGGDLKIKLNEQTNEIYMTGLATKICDGIIDETVILGT